MTQLQADICRFFAGYSFDANRTREISDVHVSPVQRAALRERLETCRRYDIPARRPHAARLIAQVDAL